MCAVLKCAFDDSHFLVEYVVRFFGSLFSYVISGLFVVEVIRNREMALRHLGQITHDACATQRSKGSRPSWKAVPRPF